MTATIPARLTVMDPGPSKVRCCWCGAHDIGTWHIPFPICWGCAMSHAREYDKPPYDKFDAWVEARLNYERGRRGVWLDSFNVEHPDISKEQYRALHEAERAAYADLTNAQQKRARRAIIDSGARAMKRPRRPRGADKRADVKRGPVQSTLD